MRHMLVVVPILLSCCASEEITVRRLFIRDASGRVRIELLGDTKEGPTVRVLDESGRARLRIAHRDGPDGSIVVEVRSADDNGPAIELLQQKDMAIASLCGEGHKRRVYIGTGGTEALLSLNAGRGGNTRIELECAERGAAVLVTDIENVSTVHLASMAADKANGARVQVQKGPEILWKSN